MSAGHKAGLVGLFHKLIARSVPICKAMSILTPTRNAASVMLTEHGSRWIELPAYFPSDR